MEPFAQSESVVRQTRLSSQRALRLSQLAHSQHVSEDDVIEKALDLMFTLSELFDDASERRAWHRLSESALYRVWENDQDAAYDNWRTLYDLRKG